VSDTGAPCKASAVAPGAARAAVGAPALARVPAAAVAAAAAGVPAAVPAALAVIRAAVPVAALGAAAALAAIAAAALAAAPRVLAASGWGARHGRALRRRELRARGRDLLAPGDDSPPGRCPTCGGRSAGQHFHGFGDVAVGHAVAPGRRAALVRVAWTRVRESRAGRTETFGPGQGAHRR